MRRISEATTSTCAFAASVLPNDGGRGLPSHCDGTIILAEDALSSVARVEEMMLAVQHPREIRMRACAFPALIFIA